MMSWSLDPDGMAETMDNAKDVVIEQLIKEDLIGQDKGIEFAKTHTFIMKRKSTISKFLDRFKLKKSDESDYIFLLAKIDLEAEE